MRVAVHKSLCGRAALVVVFSLVVMARLSAEPLRPNIVLVMADDRAWTLDSSRVALRR